MADGSNNAKLPGKIKSRPWWRFFVQFSLRSLLILTTLAAVGCWWFLRPKSRDEQLAGKYLQLHREVRLEKVDPSVPQQRRNPNLLLIGSDRFLAVNSGHWQLRDDQENLLVRGYCANDRPNGKWTVYHVNGRKAAEGEAFRAARRGWWRTWDEEVQLTSEVTYEAREQEHVFNKPVSPEFLATLSWKSFRHGPARGWHANGKLQFEGQYQDDRRDGIWNFYDAEGAVTSTVEYQQDAIKSHAKAQRRKEEGK